LIVVGNISGAGFNLHKLRFNCLIDSYVQVVAIIRRACFYVSLQKRLNIKFCIKLGKKASHTCAVLSGAYGGEVTKNPSVLESH